MTSEAGGLAFAQAIRIHVLEQSRRANVGHIGSALSVADIIAALYYGVLQGVGTEDPDRDRFVLSKGHAALAVYSALRLLGHLSDEELDTYCSDASLLGVHPERTVTGVDFSSGSLGQGLSIAAGSALAARVQVRQRRVIALLSDAECNEGSVWEAALFAGHHRLANLTAIIDLNGQQALGYTADVLGGSLASRWSSFGWEVIEVDGHDPEQISETIQALKTEDAPPHVLLAHTTFGKGVSFMESQIRWHYMPMNADEYALAVGEVRGNL